MRSHRPRDDDNEEQRGDHTRDAVQDDHRNGGAGTGTQRIGRRLARGVRRIALDAAAGDERQELCACVLGGEFTLEELSVCHVGGGVNGEGG